MTVSVFVTFPGPAGDAAALETAFVDGPLTGLAAAPGLRFIESYQPAGETPEFQECASPPLLVELNLDEPEDAQQLLGSSRFRDVLTLSEHGQATVDVFHAVQFPLPGHARPPPRESPLSFVVRYYRPAPDQAAFVAFYTTNHPLLLARLPGIRNVLCYLPTGIPLPEGIESSGAFFGNEVVFDDLTALNHALASDILPQLRAEGKQFPPYGHNTHRAMLRRQVYARPG